MFKSNHNLMTYRLPSGFFALVFVISSSFAIAGFFDGLLGFTGTASVLVFCSAVLFGASGMFWLQSGGRYISVIGVAVFAQAIFMLLPIIYNISGETLTAPELRVALSYILISPAIMLLGLLFPELNRGLVLSTRRIEQPLRPVAGITIVGTVVLLIDFLLSGIPGFDGFHRTLILLLAGAFMVAGALLAHTRKSVSTAIIPFLMSLALLIYWLTQLFSGFGRINATSVLLTLLLSFMSIYAKRWMKALVLAATPLGLIVGGWIREGAETIVDVILRGKHMGSAFAPFTSFVRSLELSADLIIPWSNFFEQLLLSAGGLLIPRQIWPAKPVGFGAELAKILSPAYAPSGHSDVSGIFGEHWTYFSAPGIIVGFIVLTSHLLLVSTFIRAANNVKTFNTVFAIPTVAWSMAQIISLVWVGPFTYWARVWPAIILYLLLIAVTSLFRSGKH